MINTMGFQAKVSVQEETWLNAHRSFLVDGLDGELLILERNFPYPTPGEADLGAEPGGGGVRWGTGLQYIW